jgi:hypothetical protein
MVGQIRARVSNHTVPQRESARDPRKLDRIRPAVRARPVYYMVKTASNTIGWLEPHLRTNHLCRSQPSQRILAYDESSVFFRHRLTVLHLTNSRQSPESRIWMAQSLATQHGREPNPLDTTGLCLLSLDGGGVRGLSTLHTLKGLMTRLNKQRQDAGLTPVKPCNVFDLIGGTSTGGWVSEH